MTEIELARAALNAAADARNNDDIRLANHWARIALAHATLALVERKAGE